MSRAGGLRVQKVRARIRLVGRSTLSVITQGNGDAGSTLRDFSADLFYSELYARSLEPLAVDSYETLRFIPLMSAF